MYLVDGDGLALPGKSLPLKTPIHSILAELDLFVDDEDPPAESDPPEDEVVSVPAQLNSEDPDEEAPPWTQPTGLAKTEPAANDPSTQDEEPIEDAPSADEFLSDGDSDVPGWATTSVSPEPVEEPVALVAPVEPTPVAADDTPPWASASTPAIVPEPDPELIVPEPVKAATEEPAVKEDAPPWASTPQPQTSDGDSDVPGWATTSVSPEPVEEPVALVAPVEPTPVAADDTPPWASASTPAIVPETDPELIVPEPVKAATEEPAVKEDAPPWASTPQPQTSDGDSDVPGWATTSVSPEPVKAATEEPAAPTTGTLEQSQQVTETKPEAVIAPGAVPTPALTLPPQQNGTRTGLSSSDTLGKAERTRIVRPAAMGKDASSTSSADRNGLGRDFFQLLEPERLPSEAVNNDRLRLAAPLRMATPGSTTRQGSCRGRS